MGQPAPIVPGALGGVGAAGGIIGKWFGSAISEATAFAAGIAIGPVLGPPVQALKNEVWSKYPNVPPDAMSLALGVAQGQVDAGQAATWAKEHGFGDSQFKAMVDIANVGPSLGYAFDSYRRGDLSPDEFLTALQRTGLEPQWNDAMVKLKDRLYELTTLANGMQQGFVNAEGLLQGAPDVGAATVKQNAPLGINPITEAKKLGYSQEQLQLAAELAGLPPGPELLQTWVRRGAISEQDLVNGVRQGHTKSEWAQKYLDTIPQILGHLQYVEARVRGWITNAELYAGGKLTGWQQPELDLLHKIHGRPLSWHQVFIGLQRGGKRLDPTADISAASTGIDPDFFAALQQSDIQQQWYDLAWKQRYNYPAPFVLRTLRQANEITDDVLRQVLKYIGWEPTFIDHVATAWTPKTATAAKQKAQTLSHLTQEYLSKALSEDAFKTVLTTSLGYTADEAQDEINLANFNAAKASRTKATKNLEKRYIAVQLSEADARSGLDTIGWPPGATDAFLASWNIERATTLTTLTVAQILTALKNNAILASVARPLLQELGESDAAIALIFQTYGTDPAT